MKKGLSYLFFIICISFVSNAQVNLVPNSSFEVYTQCPFNPAQVAFAFPWVDPNNGSADYFNVCSANQSIPNNAGGTQYARTGNAYMGLYVYFNNTGTWREYIQVKLDSQLAFQKNYAVEFYVSLADTFFVAANISLYFSDTAISSTSAQRLNVTPQIINNQISNPLIDKNGWTRVAGTYTANGGEKYITIGNFLDDNSTDTSHVNGGSYQFSYYYIDDISVVCTDCDTGIGISELNNPFRLTIYPTPAQNTVNIAYDLSVQKGAFLNIYDFTGKPILIQQLSGEQGEITLNTESYANGIYLCRLTAHGSTSTQRLVISH